MTTNIDTVQAGKATLHRTAGGTVWFLDKSGNKVTLSNPREAARLFEAIRDGSGEPAVIRHFEGNETHRNLHMAGKSQYGNETRTYGGGGNWMFPNGNWNE